MSRQILTSSDDFIGFCRKHVPDFSKSSEEKLHLSDISGNINRVRRVSFENPAGKAQSVIVKTVPEGGALERYPSIVFPEQRLAYEIAYYRAHTKPLSAWVPQLMGTDESEHTLLVEDLAPAVTLEDKVLMTRAFPSALITQLGQSLGTSHRLMLGEMPDILDKPNPCMQANLPFILKLPIEDPHAMRQHWSNDPLKPARMAQQKVILEYQPQLLKISQQLNERLYADAPLTLVHGDLHGGSIFVRDNGMPSVIDAELCDIASGWFDLGILCAHGHLLSKAIGVSFPEPMLLQAYAEAFPPGHNEHFLRRTRQLAGFEIIRRLLGAANVAYIQDEEALEQLVHKACDMVLSE